MTAFRTTSLLKQVSLALLLLVAASACGSGGDGEATRSTAAPTSESGAGGSADTAVERAAAAPVLPRPDLPRADTPLELQPDSIVPLAPTPQASAPAPRVCPALQAGPLAPPVRIREAPPPALAAQAAVVVDAGSGAVLWGKEEHAALQPASVTKIVTAFIAIERGNLDDTVEVGVEQRRLNIGTRMGLFTGDRYSLRDLLYGLMLPSGNDAGMAIADHIAGSEPAFAALMNDRMCELGLTDSTFVNGTGLGRGPANLASAHDLAQVTRRAMELPVFAEIARTRWYTARGSNTISVRNINELLDGYAGADGVKTGWTPGAGPTVVGSATRNGRRVIVVLLNTPNRPGEAATLLNWAFSSFRWQ